MHTALLRPPGGGAMRPPTREELSIAWEALGVPEVLGSMDARHVLGGIVAAVVGWAVCTAFLLSKVAS